MRMTVLVAAAVLITGAAHAQSPAPPSDTIKALTTKGAVFDYQGQAVDITYKADGTLTGMDGQIQGTWKADGKKLCTTITGAFENRCTEYPDGKKSGDSFEVM